VLLEEIVSHPANEFMHGTAIYALCIVAYRNCLASFSGAIAQKRVMPDPAFDGQESIFNACVVPD
jgi:hypothetical protein